MDNPFKKRRTELFGDRRTLLALVSQKPIEEFFKTEKNDLIEKLTMVVGTPGCGKTTIAQVTEFESLITLCQAGPRQINKELLDILYSNQLIKENVPTILGHRMAMSTNFRDIWELPYPEAMRSALLRAFVQSKAVLGWFRQLEGVEIDLANVQIEMGSGADSLIAVTDASDPAAFREYARSIELAIFKIVTALVPPDEREMANRFLNTSYDVFEGLKGIRINQWPSIDNAASTLLRPMIVIDDAHELHPQQFIQLRDWLKSKAIGVSRWLMCRPDVVSPEDYRDAMNKEAANEAEQSPGSKRGRDYVIKLMQLTSTSANRFKPIAEDISKRYIAALPEFSRRQIKELAPMLEQNATLLADGQMKTLTEQVQKLAKEAHFSEELVATLKARIPATARKDEALAALRILLHRERNRSPQLGLLPEDSIIDEPVTKDRQAGSSLIEGARIQLLHEFDRPYYFGMDKLISASNTNIEQFIGLADSLVDVLLGRIIRGNPPEVSARQQHNTLVAHANRTMSEWDFPYNAAVRELVKKIADRCVKRTLRPNAPLDNGANAIGVPQDEMDRVLERSERLTRILHFAFAYKALVFVPQYRCKNRVWCLLELGALPCLAYGLTLNRGGFIEDTLSGLQSLLPADGA